MPSPLHSPAIPLAIPNSLRQESGARQFQDEPDIPWHITSSLPHQWHPKITIYRLIIISTGIGLGATKACASSRGETITLEWIAGVVLSLSLFILSWFDNPEYYPSSISLLFSYDCMDLLWRLLNVISIPKPEYRSDERIHIFPPVPYSYHPPITGYRICVSASVVVFGVVKATCSYMGLNSSASTLDWVFAAIISTSLYLLGLYEDNTRDIFPFLFTTDYSRTVGGIFYTALPLFSYGMGITACASWLVFWYKGPFASTSFALETPTVTDPPAFAPTFVDDIHGYAIIFVMSSIILAAVLLAVPPLMFFLWRFGRLIHPLRRGSLMVYKHTMLWYLAFLNSHPLITRIHSVGAAYAKLLAYIVLHLFAIAYFAMTSVVFAGFSVRSRSEFDSEDASIFSFVEVPTAIYSLAVVIAPCSYLIFLAIRSLVSTVRAHYLKAVDIQVPT